MSATHDPVAVDRLDDGVAVITLDRPKANAIDAPTSRLLGDAFATLHDDPAIRVVIFTGAGDRFFSAGWDLGAAAAGESFDSDYGVGGFGGFADVPNRRVPVIAAVNGMAVGGGFEIALAADMIVAADHAQFFLPEASLGVLPDAGSIRLPRALPRAVATEVLVAGRRLSAADAAHFGLVNRVVPGSDLMAAAVDLARAVTASAPLSVAAILDIARSVEPVDPSSALAQLRDRPSYRRAIDSADAIEGVRAFNEKRSPMWKGQ